MPGFSYRKALRGVPSFLAAIFLAGRLWGQNGPVDFGFEAPPVDWQRTGNFAGERYCGPYTTDIFEKSELGGDYWSHLSYPVGQADACLLTSVTKSAGSVAAGSLASPVFILDAARQWLSWRIGGTLDVEHERVELLVRVSSDRDAELAALAQAWWRSFPDLRLPAGFRARDGEWLAVGAATGRNSNMLRQVAAEIPAPLRGMMARVRVVDGPTGTISVDAIRLTESAPPALHAPVWGFADYHTHPMSYLALGGLRGIHTIFGTPGDDAGTYDPEGKKVTIDIPHCTWGHRGGYFAEAFLKSSQLARQDAGSVIKAIFSPHPRSGGPEFAAFPGHLMGAHQQMHVTGIYRSYLGGLRLMVALAVDNKAAPFLEGKVKGGHIDLATEKESIEAQLAGMTRLAKQNYRWMQIASSAQEARDIIRDNKLAVVLGVEYDQLGELGLGTEDQEPRLEADYLWNLGARTVIPIHAIDNKLGGPAISNEPYNWLNDFLHHRSVDDHASYVRGTTPEYFRIEEDTGNCAGTPKRGECVLHRLNPSLELRLALGHPLLNLLRLSPVVFPAPKVGEYDTKFGHRNRQGLTGMGRDYINALMDRGLVVDLAHMSDQSIDDTLSEVRKRAAARQGCGGKPECGQSSPDWQAMYPLIMSHAHMRAQGLYESSAVEDYRPSEYDISDSHLEMLKAIGGVVGPFIAEPRIESAKGNDPYDGVHLKFDADCGGSSTDFAYSFAYASLKVNTNGDPVSRVGLATDMTLIPMVSPRFGKGRCDGYVPYRHGREHKAAHPEYYREGAQKQMVRYTGQPANGHPELKPYRMGPRTYDFNNDGMANYGLLPDLMQDLKDLGDDDLGTMFRSAEGFLQMWEKVERLSGSVCCQK
jgi:microsomal dipeptidase-like Zn-dependent dipeptidase